MTAMFDLALAREAWIEAHKPDPSGTVEFVTDESGAPHGVIAHADPEEMQELAARLAMELLGAEADAAHEESILESMWEASGGPDNFMMALYSTLTSLTKIVGKVMPPEGAAWARQQALAGWRTAPENDRGDGEQDETPC